MKTPRVEDFDPSKAASSPDMGMDNLPRIERPKTPPTVILDATARPSAPVSNRDTTVSRHHDTMTPPAPVSEYELVRRAVREFGKEAATHRFTLQEKKALAELIYAFRQLDIRTNENEIARIAINYVVVDFRRNGDKSILARVLRLLNA